MATHSTLPSTPYAAGITRAATLDATLSHAVFRLQKKQDAHQAAGSAQVMLVRRHACLTSLQQLPQVWARVDDDSRLSPGAAELQSTRTMMHRLVTMVKRH